MSKRKEDRQQQILRELAETPTLRIGDMARTHGVSTETIRRDLDELTRRGVLNRTYGGAVRAVCRAILPGHPQDAEEAEADTFYKLWRGARLPADEVHRRRLGVLTARQCAIDRYRALLRRGETLPLDDRDDAELAVALESELETRELMAQVMALPPPDGELFLRRYVYGETAAQLGVHFNMPAATVRTRLHRARLALQKLLREG